MSFRKPAPAFGVSTPSFPLPPRQQSQRVRPIRPPRPVALGRLAVVVALLCASSVSSQILDDFESYQDTAELQGVWRFSNSLDTATPNLRGGTQSLRREGFTSHDGSGWITLLDFDPPLDLSGLPGLEVLVRRDPAGVSTLRFAIFARDADGFSCAPQGVPLISDTDWHTSVLDFHEFCGAVDLAEIVQISLNATNKSGGAGDVLANFDDLAVMLLSDGFESGDLSAWSGSGP